MCQSALARTVPGYWAEVSITLPITFTLRSLAASETPNRSAYMTSAPASIIAKAASLALGGSYQELMKATENLTSGFRSEEHTSELQSRLHLVCRLLLEKKKKATQDLAESGA